MHFLCVIYCAKSWILIRCLATPLNALSCLSGHSSPGHWPGATHFRGEFELPLRFCFVLIRPCPGSDPLFLF